MKKLPLWLSLVLGAFIWGAFSIPVDAATIYQQLTDSSGQTVFISNHSTPIASFTTQSTNLIGTSATTSVLFVLTNNSNSVSITYGGNAPQLIICTTNGSCPSQFASIVLSECVNVTIAPGESRFCGGFVTGSNGNTSWSSGTYYIYTDDPHDGGNHAYLQTNLSSDFVYGYLSDQGGNSIPVAPGIPGFTDSGIATTSLQVYCNSNFSTSSGLLDNVGKSVSLGICNVSVFLFVPSQGAISQWQGLATTTRNKIPFSYYYDFRDIVNGSSASSSVNFSPFSIDFSSVDFSSSTSIGSLLPGRVDFLSTTTINRYLPTGMHDTIFVLMRSAIWIGVLFMFYRRIVPEKAKI
jgi:hypothetical protein